MITVRELMDLFYDVVCQKVKIYDVKSEKFIFNGTGASLTDDIGNLEVLNIDNIGKNIGTELVINVELED